MKGQVDFLLNDSRREQRQRIYGDGCCVGVYCHDWQLGAGHLFVGIAKTKAPYGKGYTMLVAENYKDNIPIGEDPVYTREQYANLTKQDLETLYHYIGSILNT